MAASVRPGQASDLVRAAALFLALLSFYFVGYSRVLPAGADEMLHFAVTQSVAKWQTVAIDQVSTVGPAPEEFGVGGHRFSKKGPLLPLAAVPLFWAAQRLPIGAVDTVLLANQIITALTVALFFLLARRMGYARGVALALALVLAICTPLWVYSKSFFSEPATTLCFVATLLCAYAAATSRGSAWHIAAGLAFGMAVAAKNVNGVLLLPVPVYLAWAAASTRSAAGWPGGGPPSSGRRAARRSLLAVARFALGAAPVGLLLLGYSWVRYGTPLSTGYGEWETFSTPVLQGAAGILFSPGKGIFVYTPLLLMLPLWAPAFVRRFGAFAALLGSIVALHLVVYGSWYVWWGAWAWASRFTVPMLPLLVLMLGEGASRARGAATTVAVLALAGASAAIQLAGLAVRNDVFMFELLPIDPRPDTLTLYDLSRSPILNQLRFLTRQHLDFAWINPTGPSPVSFPALFVALAGVATAVVGLLVVWRSSRPVGSRLALAVAALAVAGTIYADLRIYYRQADPAIVAVADAIAGAPVDAGVLQLVPSSTVAYYNWQKRGLPELGWIEGADPDEVILSRLRDLSQRCRELWVVTETPAKVPSNGIEATLNRSLVEVGQQSFGRYRLLRYLTRPDDASFTRVAWTFADGIELVGFRVNGGMPAPGQVLSLTLEWRGDDVATRRPDYTVFVHLVGADGALVAQHDGPPAGAYAPTGSWGPGQLVFDHHPIAIPTSAPAGLHLVRVGLYSPASGERLPLLDREGKPIGDAATLDLGVASGR